jgi:protein involved in polysaccharide export with SLBB domain
LSSSASTTTSEAAPGSRGGSAAPGRRGFFRLAPALAALLFPSFLCAQFPGARVAPTPASRQTQPATQAQGAQQIYQQDPYAADVPAAPYAPSAPSAPVDPNAVLSPGDQLTFVIEEDREPALLLRVTDSGELEVPYIGRVRASGRSAQDVASEIKRRLEADYYYRATVRLGIDQVSRSAAPLGRVFVSGLVRAPGPIPMLSGESLSLSGAILKAGGFAQFADSRKVKLTRKSGGSSSTRVIDVKAILEQGKLDLDVPLEDGDFIHVPQRLINW